jgi:Asp-tRNA(Asn)/Glu-tRNA(Gln) amidotransferase A subunit family amidase
LPVAVQFVGNLFDESAVIRAGRAFQFSTNWHQRHPSI